MYSDLIRKTGIYSLATIVSRMTSLVMLPFYTRILTPADYGVMELLDLTASIVGLLLGARVGSALFYYYFSASTTRERDQWVGNLFLFAIALGVTIAAITIPASGWISIVIFGTPNYASYFRLLFVGCACSLPVELGNSCVRAFNEAGLFVKVTIIQTLSSVALNILFLTYFHLGIKSMLMTGMIAPGGVALFLAWHALSSRRFSVDWPKIFQAFRYCIPLGLSGLAVFVIHYGDRAFLRRSVSLGDLGVYSLAYKFGMMLAFVHAPFQSYWSSRVCEIVRLPEGDRMYVRTTTLLIAGLTFFTLVMAFYSEVIVRIMAGPAFASAGALVPWIGLAYLVRAVGAHLQNVFTVEGRPGLELRVNAVGSAACLVAYATLIPRYRLWGAVAATLIGFLVILLYGYSEAQRVRRFHFEYRRLSQIGAAAAFTAAGFYASRPSNMWLQAAAASVWSAVFPVLVFYCCLDGGQRAELSAKLIGFLKKQPGPTQEAAV